LNLLEEDYSEEADGDYVFDEEDMKLTFLLPILWKKWLPI